MVWSVLLSDRQNGYVRASAEILFVNRSIWKKTLKIEPIRQLFAYVAMLRVLGLDSPHFIRN